MFFNNPAPTAYRFSEPIVRNFLRVASICILGSQLRHLLGRRPCLLACESFFKGYAVLRGIKTILDGGFLKKF